MENDKSSNPENAEKAEEETSTSGTSRNIDEEKTQTEMKQPSAAMLSPGSTAKIKKPEVRDSTSKSNASTATSSGSAMSSGSATGNPRNKIALAPGHSLMDWIRLGSSGKDLTGVGGQIKSITPSELALHNEQKNAWIAIQGLVFNITEYMDFHPGGIPELMRGVGKDATKLFNDVHPWVNYQSILQKCFIGKLEHSTKVEHAFKSDKKE